MPYKSNLQRRYLNWAASKGKIKQSIVDEYNEASKGLKLPEEKKKNKRFNKIMSVLKK